MDEDVFTHLKRVISYLYKNTRDDSLYNEEDLLKKLNIDVLNTIVDGYVGYSWMCEACATWIADATTYIHESKVDGDTFNTKEYFKRRKIISIDESTRESYFYADKPKISNKNKALNVLYDSLASLLAKTYDTDIMRDYMDNQKDLKSWNPPLSYWQLMQSPVSVSHMIKLYRDRPKDAFLSAWYQDYTNNYQQNSIMEKSQLTSNFSVYTLRLSEEIRKFLLEDDIAEVDPTDSGTISDLFLHAENAYIYTQALLHFIYQWRVDLKGCRRLSQLMSMSILNPKGAASNRSNMEYSASQINLLMTNFTKFQCLYRLFRQISHSLNGTNSTLDIKDVCEFGYELQKTLDKFESYESLLFERDARKPNNDTAGAANGDDISKYAPDGELEFEDPSVSQCGGYGDPANDYKRLRDAPEMPPLEAIRESSLLECLINNFADPDLSLSADQAWIKYANLIVLLSVPSPYEMLYQAYEEHLSDNIKRSRRGHVWQDYESESQHSDLSPDSLVESPSRSTTSAIDRDSDRNDNSLDDSSSPFGSSVLESIITHESSNGINKDCPDDQISSDQLHKQISLADITHCTNETSSMNTYTTTDCKSTEGMDVQSMIDSEIYKDVNHNKKLGTLPNLNPMKIQEMKELFKEFKETSTRHKNIARKELFEIYRITHDSLKSKLEIEQQLLHQCHTNIACSTVLSYISHNLNKNDNGLTPVSVLLLKNIADRQPVKRKPILALIRRFSDKIFQCIKSRMSLEIIGLVTDLLVYMIRYESLYPAVITTVLDMVQCMDRVYVRKFISGVLLHCAPPYKVEFAMPLLELILKSGIILPGDSEQTFTTLILEFIENCKSCKITSHIEGMIQQLQKQFGK
ncbi:conserved Plasmodium protein, unknown function [Babesia microti strain RI]|uniref:Uncharacterized protein n=1 Tax=Babesia microti (strain RI) TaxID=1133968 RepID=A0A1R4AAY5_BABMR|nr:conserved Plasmodium protein, unknown function [Babesia microti strain RI]SJK86147.1 conserved Plasmodium protein, unknown function [Babesia microti strain RI]|eukprot:XP_021338340.1 conserved Plasmodium protein, unknown function [Babesia microti strain RI]